MELKLWPMVRKEEAWSIPDSVLRGVWFDLVMNGKAEITFYDGSVMNEDEFIRYMKNPGQSSIFVADTSSKKIIAVAWINNLDDGVAYVHFCFIDKFVPDVGKMVLRYWTKLEHQGKPLVKVIVGVTPESYTAAVKAARFWGFHILGTIPSFCHMAYMNRREGGVISYYLTGGNHE